MDMMEEEQAYIRQILAGDTDTYRNLVERYQTGVIIHCENIVKDRDDAEDVAQETFVKAYQELKNFEETKGRFSTWLYRIATNLCIDLLRRNKRKVDIDNIEAYIETSIPTYIEDDENSRLRTVINSLEPPKYADIIKGYFWEGKSYQTLAEEYQTTTGTIGSWLTRAKAQLKEKLHEKDIV